jgi:hypothetical protein
MRSDLALLSGRLLLWSAVIMTDNGSLCTQDPTTHAERSAMFIRLACLDPLVHHPARVTWTSLAGQASIFMP